MDDTYTEVLQDINTKIDALVSTQKLLDEAMQLNKFARNDLISSLNEVALRVTDDGLDSPSFNEHINEIIFAVHESENNEFFARYRVEPT